MAETIAESMAYCDAIGNEHTPARPSEEALGARAIADNLGVPFEEAQETLATTREVESLAAKRGTVMISVHELRSVLYALTVSGFLYGVRWEQQREATHRV